MVSDFAPGHDAEAGFQRAFKEAGGEIIGAVRFPVANPDFSAFVQRAKDLNPEAIFLFVPAGAQPAAFGKAVAERGLDPKAAKILGTGETTAEQALKSMGDAALGIVTAWNYDYNDDTQLNKEFVKQFNEMNKRNPDFMSVGGYDGMHLIFEALRKTGGRTDADAMIAAVKGNEVGEPARASSRSIRNFVTSSRRYISAAWSASGANCAMSYSTRSRTSGIQCLRG